MRRAPLLVLLLVQGPRPVDGVGLCEEYCSSPCTELNGDVNIECAGCTEEFACRPGVAGFGPAGRIGRSSGTTDATPSAVQTDHSERRRLPELSVVVASNGDASTQQTDPRAGPLQPGLLKALGVAREQVMDYECETVECDLKRQQNVKTILSALDAGAAAESAIPMGSFAGLSPRNASVIGFLVYTSSGDDSKEKMGFYGESCFPIEFQSKEAPSWIRAITTRPDLLAQRFYCGDEHSKHVPHYIAIAAYMIFELHLDVRLLTCNERGCLQGTEGLGAIIVRQTPPGIVLRLSSEVYEPLREVSYALLHRLEQSGISIFPPLPIMWYGYSKRRYYSKLRDAGIPQAPFIGWTSPTTPLEAADAALRTGWPTMIVKPGWHYHARCGFGSRGVFNVQLNDEFEGNRSREEVARQLEEGLRECAPQGHVDATLMRFEPSVASHYEMRSWWLLGEYSHTIATKPNQEETSNRSQ